jgi:CRISPR-associated protein (TIGR02710 family)
MSRKVVVLTVGMGFNADPQASLYGPLERSMREQPADKIWLFPSRQSLVHAEHLRTTLADMPIVVAEPLPESAEEDPNVCYAFFQKLFDAVLADGTRPSQVELDYTRGTKTMSAAAMLAAVSRRVERFRYVSGERGENNLVKAGTEQVRVFSAASISADRELEAAKQLMALQRYSAIPTVIARWQERYPVELHAATRHLAACAEFWDAWDRLEYSEAARRFSGTQDIQDWYTPSGQAGEAIQFLGRSRHLPVAQLSLPTWALVFDLLENSRRRLAQAQFEDVLLRAYRSLELMGQAELYRYGFETDGADPENAEIKAWIAYRRKEGKSIPEIKTGTGYELSKDWVGSLLKHLKSPLAHALNNFDTGRVVQAKQRNKSLLIHGFEAQATSERAVELSGMLEVGLPGIARRGVPDELRWIESAVRFPVR